MQYKTGLYIFISPTKGKLVCPHLYIMYYVHARCLFSFFAAKNPFTTCSHLMLGSTLYFCLSQWSLRQIRQLLPCFVWETENTTYGDIFLTDHLSRPHTRLPLGRQWASQAPHCCSLIMSHYKAVHFFATFVFRLDGKCIGHVKIGLNSCCLIPV